MHYRKKKKKKVSETATNIYEAQTYLSLELTNQKKKN